MPKGDAPNPLTTFASGPVAETKVHNATISRVHDLWERVYELENAKQGAAGGDIGETVLCLVYSNGILGYMGVRASGDFVLTF